MNQQSLSYDLSAKHVYTISYKPLLQKAVIFTKMLSIAEIKTFADALAKSIASNNNIAEVIVYDSDDEIVYHVKPFTTFFSLQDYVLIKIEKPRWFRPKKIYYKVVDKKDLTNSLRILYTKNKNITTKTFPIMQLSYGNYMAVQEWLNYLHLSHILYIESTPDDK